MEPFSPEVLTILTIISICLIGVTCLAVLIIGLIILCRRCLKRRRPKAIKPIRTPSILSNDELSPRVTPIPNKSHDQHKRTTRHYETPSVLDELSYSGQPNKYQQQDFMHDDNDETTVKNDNRTFIQRQQKRSFQNVKPVANLRITDRQTPYPADVIAREKLMNNTRFPMDSKY